MVLVTLMNDVLKSPFLSVFFSTINYSSPIFRIRVEGLETLRNQWFWAFYFGKLDDIVGFPEGSLREIVTIRI